MKIRPLLLTSLWLFFIFFLSAPVYSQSPEAVNYQAVFREDSPPYNLLSDTGITKTYLLEQTKEVVDNGEARDSDKLRALETLMKISGMLNTEKKTESLALIQEFTGFSQEKLNAFKTGELTAGVKE